MDKKIAFAVVGCGHIGQRHATMVQRNNESSLAALVEIDDAKKAMLESQYQVP